MKKSLWLLLVVAALIAVFAVAGCMQGTTPEEEETTTPPPTTPPPDTACPKVVSTTVSKLYASAANDPNFQITIVFDEAITPASCIYDPSNWTIKIENSVAYVIDNDGDEAYEESGTYSRKLEIGSGISGIKISVGTDGKSIIVKAKATDTKNGYEGLICSEADVKDFINKFDDETNDYSKSASATYYADKVSWKLAGCAIADSLGNVCCTFSGDDCCEEPYCEECVPQYCPTTPGSCY